MHRAGESCCRANPPRPWASEEVPEIAPPLLICSGQSGLLDGTGPCCGFHRTEMIVQQQQGGWFLSMDSKEEQHICNN